MKIIVKEFKLRPREGSCNHSYECGASARKLVDVNVYGRQTFHTYECEICGEDSTSSPY